MRDSQEPSSTRKAESLSNSDLRNIPSNTGQLFHVYFTIPCIFTDANMEDGLSCHTYLHHSLCSVILINETSPLNVITPFPSPSDTFLYSLIIQLMIAYRRMTPIIFSAPIPHAPSSGDDNYINSNDDADVGYLNEFKKPKKAILTMSKGFSFWKHLPRNIKCSYYLDKNHYGLQVRMQVKTICILK